MAKMIRTQIHLDEEVLRLLDREAARTGASRAELIRRAVRAAFGSKRPPRSLGFVGIASVGEFDPERLDDELGDILEEKFGRPS
jgi:metal-responsive CopG/Arc/MetJ family transcriptional regulator